MKLFLKRVPGWLPFFLVAAVPGFVFGTGGWVPERWLDEGGKSLQGSPEFYWDIELTRLAQQYSEKNLPFQIKASPLSEEGEVDRKTNTAKADLSDFEDALKSQRVQPADAATARNAHKLARTRLDAGARDPVPAEGEVDSEFADYHRAAALYAHKDFTGAKTAWAKLLQRPAEQRHYRSVWAAYMLGKCCLLDEKTRGEAITWFEKCREFARAGFPDSEGLAADSFGWQARAEYDCDNPSAAARHYLQQLALGDESAIASLKLLVPDRGLGDFLPLSFATYPAPVTEPSLLTNQEAAQTEAKLQAARDRAAKRLTAAAKDPVLRQIITAHILATSSSGTDTEQQTRLVMWLAAVQQAQLAQVEGAASLGWVAYRTGRFPEAEKWVSMEQPATPLGQWLKAKLAMRKGDFTGASSLMGEVVRQLPDDAAIRDANYSYLPRASASADLGATLLAQGKLKESFDAFWRGGCWADAGYVADRLLTTDELLAFVKANAMLTDEERDQQPNGDGETPAAMHWEMKTNLMNLAGRRLIREDRIVEGRVLLGMEPRKLFDQFREQGALGPDEKRPNQERAKALFTAACILRDGSSWCGTEDDVVRANWGGYAPENPETLVQSRLTGKSNTSEDNAAENSAKPVTNFIPSSGAERKRLHTSSGQQPGRQYVRQASALAVKAASLLPDNTEETADVLNQAGRWIQDLDNLEADKIYFQIEKRCPHTKIGKAVIEKHWFIEPNGPWTWASDQPAIR